MALLLGDEAALVLLLDLGDALLVPGEDLLLVGGMTMSFFEIVIPACVAYLKPSVLIVSSTPAIACAP